MHIDSIIRVKRFARFQHTLTIYNSLPIPAPTITMISPRMPEDMVDDLKHIAPQLAFSGYHSLMTVYIGQGLREDLERRDDDEKMSLFIESLPKQGVGNGVIASVMAEFNEVH